MGSASQTFVRLAAWLRGVIGTPSRVDIAPMPRSAPRSVARTDVGRVRQINEDRVLDLPERGVWAVADGMGGLSAGDVAAQIAVTTLAAIATVDAPGVLDAIRRASAAILAQGGGRSGSTIVAAQIAGDELNLFWAGDSRAYHIRGTQVRQVTRDHSLVQDLIDAGLLAEDQREGHPRANVVTRALGVTADLVVDTLCVPLMAGDRVLLCSDGVSRSIDLRDLARCEPIETLADRLLAAALARDGSDNASLVLIAV